MPNESNYIGIAMGLDVTSLKAGLSEADKAIRLANSEFKKATSGLDDWTKSAEGIRAKVTQLTSVLDMQKKKLAGLQAEYDKTVSAQGENSEAARKLLTALNNQAAVVGRTERELNNYQETLKEAESGSLDLETATLRAGKAIQKTGSNAKKSSKDVKTLEKVSKTAKTALLGLYGGITALAGGFLASAEATREFRTNMGKVETAFSTAGFSAKDAEDTYTDFYAVLGDEGKATEAVSHLGELAKSQKDLKTWTNIATGVYAKFGDSLPIEGLTEAANETAKTGHLTGVLADALNWVGASEEYFQGSLDKCTTEQERQALITDTLNGLYSDASKQYRETNKDIIAAKDAQVQLRMQMAEVGEMAEPVMTEFKLMGAEILKAILPIVEDMMPKIKEVTGSFGKALTVMSVMAKTLSGVIAGEINKIKMNPIVEPIVSWASESFTKFKNAVTTGDWTGIIDGLATAISIGATIFLVAGSVASLAKSITNALSANLTGFDKGLVGAGLLGAVTIGVKVKEAMEDGDWNTFGANIVTGILAGMLAGGLTGSIKNGLIVASLTINLSLGSKLAKLINEEIKNINNPIIEPIISWTSKSFTDFKTALETGDWSGILEGLATTISIGAAITFVAKSATDLVKSIINGLSISLPGFDKATAGAGLLGAVAIGVKFAQAMEKGDWDSFGADMVAGILAGLLAGGLTGSIKNGVIVASLVINLKLGSTALDGLKKLLGERKITIVPDVDTGDIGTQIDGGGPYNAKVGVNVDTDEIQRQVNETNLDPIELTVETKTTIPKEDEIQKEVDRILSIINDESKGAIDRFNEAFNTTQIGKILGLQLAQGLGIGMGQMDSLTETQANQVMQIFKDKWEIHSPSKFMERMGEYLADGLGLSADEFAKIGELIVEEFSDGTIGFGEVLSNMQTAISAFWKDAEEESKEGAEEVGTAIETGTTPPPVDTRTRWQKFADNMKAGLDKASENLQKWKDNVGKYISQVAGYFDTLTSNVMKVATAISDAFQQAWDQEMDALEERLEAEEAKRKEANNALIAQEKEKTDERKKAYQAECDTAIQSAQNEASESLATLKQQYLDGKISSEQYTSERKKLAEKLASQTTKIQEDANNKVKQLEADLVAYQKKMNNEKSQSEIDLQKQRDELGRKAFEANKQVQIANIWINAASATARAWAENFWPVALGITAAIATEAGIQSGIIEKQQYTPALAKGGVVDNPTMALIGEAGKEAVIPLERNTGWMAELADKLGRFLNEDLDLEGLRNNLDGLKDDMKGTSVSRGAGTVTNNDNTKVINAGLTVNYNGTLSRKQIRKTEEEYYRNVRRKLAMEGV